MTPRRLAIAAGLLLVLLVVNGLIAAREAVIREGEQAFLELAPVDPRSLIQGDYMDLDYAIVRGLESDGWAPDGALVITLDADRVARFVRRHEAGVSLADGERLLRYRLRSGVVRLGSHAFFFQEGTADRYESAKYGEVRLDDGGDSVLIGLRDETFMALGPAELRYGD